MHGNCSSSQLHSFTVTDLGASRKTTYDSLLRFPPPPANASDDSKRRFRVCSNIRNPIFNFSPVCIERCAASLDDSQIDSRVEWQVLDGNGTVVDAADTCEQSDERVLVCESLETQVTVDFAGRSTPDQFKNCDEFAQRGNGVSLPVFLLKSVILSGILLFVETVMRMLLLASQVRTKGKQRSSAFLCRKGALCACSTLSLALIFLGSVALIAVGVVMVGSVGQLWNLFLTGLVISIFIKYAVFSPLKIVAMYLIKRFCPFLCALTPCLIDEGDFFTDEQLEEASRRNEYDGDALDKEMDAT